MFWPMLHITLAFLGVAVLGVLAVRVGLEVRRFAQAVADSSERVSLAAGELERAALPLARQGQALGHPRRPGPDET